MLGQQQLRRVRRQPDHRHRRSKPLNCERELCASARVYYSTSAATSPLGWETKSSCSNMRDRSGGRPIELVAEPIVEGGGSDQFQRKLVHVALGARPRRIPPIDPASGSASAPCMLPTTPSKAMNRLPMIFSCGDRKPGHHLGIKIPRIGLPLFGLCIPDERRRGRLADPQDESLAGRCRSSDLV